MPGSTLPRLQLTIRWRVRDGTRARQGAVQVATGNLSEGDHTRAGHDAAEIMASAAKRQNDKKSEHDTTCALIITKAVADNVKAAIVSPNVDGQLGKQEA